MQYVELHGTGTRSATRSRRAALGAALGADAPTGTPLLVGSAKTNVGHLEGAAGIVGLLKVVLSLAPPRAPGEPQLRRRRTRASRWTTLGLRVQRELARLAGRRTGR